MSGIIETFAEVVNRYRRDSGRLVLALSGGLDSRVMLQALAAYRQSYPEVQVCAVHIHHGLSQNADDWLEACRGWCRELGIPFHGEYASLDKNSGDSLEAQAREARYRLLSAYIGHDDLLLTAQHADDQLETVLLALKRGSGPRGLAAMGACSSFEQGWLVRPFLGVTREALCDYARAQNLDWVEDESNQDVAFDRNFLRHEVIPALVGRWPHIQQSASRSAALCYEQELLLDELLAAPFRQALNPDRSLNIGVLESMSERVRERLLRMWFDVHSLPMPGKKVLGQIINEVMNATQDANPELISAGVSIRRFQGSLYIVDACVVPPGWQASLDTGVVAALPDTLGSVIVSGDPQQHQQGMTLRAPAADERMWLQFNPGGLILHPEGRNGSRKLKKLFQEYQIPPWKRSFIPILMYNEQVAAVGDLFVCKGFTGTTHRFYWKKI